MVGRQGIDLIDDVPTVADVVTRLRREYVEACQAPSMADVAAPECQQR